MDLETSVKIGSLILASGIAGGYCLTVLQEMIMYLGEPQKVKGELVLSGVLESNLPPPPSYTRQIFKVLFTRQFISPLKYQGATLEEKYINFTRQFNSRN